MKRLTILLAFFCLALTANTQDTKMNAYVDALMKKMTLEEKVGQLNLPSIGFDITGPILSQDVEGKIRKGMAGGVFNTYTPTAVRKLQEIAVTQTRLKIPLLFGYDVIHGHRTIFPIPLGLSASWDLSLIERTARAAAEEASADGLNWVFSPMVDIARDPRWGRASEGAGEDPYLGSLIAESMVRGYQGSDLSANNTVMACIKHIALYGAAEAGRDYNTVDMSRLRMYNEYLPPYKAAVKAGAGSIMTSFNEIDGIPASGNKWLLTTLLRKEWGFDGLIASDYTAISEMIKHGMGDEKAVGALSLNAGMDMDMVSEIFLNYGVELVKTGKVSEAQVNMACRKVLEAKYKLGLFDDPFRYISEERNKQQIMSSDKLLLSKEAAIKSFVLLKNDNNILPLSGERKIAFIGPFVKDQRDLIGNWSGAGDWKKAISVWDAVSKRVTAAPITYAKGCNITDDISLAKKLNDHDAQIVADAKSPLQLIDEAVAVATSADILVVMLGEPFSMSGEAASRTNINLFDNQQALLRALQATGKPIVLVLMNGRPLALEWESKNCAAILEAWYPGTMAGPAINEVLYGDASPQGKLSMTFPVSVGQVPIYYNHKNTGRPINEKDKFTSKYLDASNEPLYPFGYGLAYTKFTYGDISLSRNVKTQNEAVTASVTVTNSGSREGTETVQLYIRDKAGSITRPVKELKGFQKLSLKPGESRTVSFRITQSDLSFYNSDLKWVAEPGEFDLMIGGNSRDVKSAAFTLK
jgi:beta-glucosidase